MISPFFAPAVAPAVHHNFNVRFGAYEPFAEGAREIAAGESLPLLRLEINRGADCAGGVVAYYAVAVQSAEPHVGVMRLNQCPLTIVIDFA